jgi:hypothetical protein
MRGGKGRVGLTETSFNSNAPFTPPIVRHNGWVHVGNDSERWTAQSAGVRGNEDALEHEACFGETLSKGIERFGRKS